jgi:hypothetical protein
MGLRIPMLECLRFGLYQHSIHSKIALASSSRVCQAFVSSSSSCIVPQKDSIIALSKQSPTVPIEASRPAVRRRCPNAHEVYCVQCHLVKQSGVS